VEKYHQTAGLPGLRRRAIDVGVTSLNTVASGNIGAF
jgi:hypothetical protein